MVTGTGFYTNKNSNNSNIIIFSLYLIGNDFRYEMKKMQGIFINASKNRTVL